MLASLVGCVHVYIYIHVGPPNYVFVLFLDTIYYIILICPPSWVCLYSASTLTLCMYVFRLVPLSMAGHHPGSTNDFFCVFVGWGEETIGASKIM